MRLILIVGAVLIAGALAWYVNQQIKEGRRTETRVEQQVIREPAIGVVVAKRDLPVGTLLAPKDVEFQNWPESTVREEYFTDSQQQTADENVAGSVVKLEIVAGEPVIPSKIINPEDRGFLAAVLRPGMKAISIPVNDRTGVSGLVFPGDIVDIILTHTVEFRMPEDEEVDDFTRVAGETIIRGARVVSVGQYLAQPAESTSAVVDTVTLELTPELAEAVALANEVGRLTVALSPLQKTPEEQAKLDTPEYKEKAETYPYMLQGVADKSFYTGTWDFEVSPKMLSIIGDSMYGNKRGKISIFKGRGSKQSTEVKVNGATQGN